MKKRTGPIWAEPQFQIPSVVLHWVVLRDEVVVVDVVSFVPFACAGEATVLVVA